MLLVAGAHAAWRVTTAAAAAPVTLATTELGQGPALVFVPDMGMSRTVWMPTARRLLAGRRIVLVDLPGHGDSPLPDPFSFQACADALDQVLAKEHGDSTIVIGQGVGGLIAALATRAHPGHVRGVVLIDVAMKSPLKIEDQQRQMFLTWMDDNYDTAVRQMYSQRGRDSTQSAELISQVSMVKPATLKLYIRELLSLDQASALKGFPRRVLYVGSERGWPAGKPWSVLSTERGLDAMATPDTLHIGASAQLIMKDQPDSLAAAIAGFAARVIPAK